MSAFDPDNFSHQYFRRLDEKLDRLLSETGDIKGRLSSVEEHLGYVMTSIGGVNRRIDRIDERFDRVARRLDIKDDILMEKNTEFKGPDA